MTFTARLAGMSLLMSGAAFAFFSVFMWSVVQHSHLERLDQMIQDGAYRHLLILRDGIRWHSVDTATSFVAERLEGRGYLILVKDGHGDVAYQTDGWPGGLDASRFPTPEEIPEGGYLTDGRGLPPPPGGPHPPGRGPHRNPGDGSPPAGGPPPGGGPYGGPPPAGPYGGQGGGPHMRGPALEHLRRDRPDPAPQREPEYFSWREGGAHYRIGVTGDAYYTLAMGLDMGEHGAAMGALRAQVIGVALVTLVLIAAGSWWIARRAIVPVKALTLAAEAITAKDLNQRLPAQNYDPEFARLTAVFNEMLERLEQSFHQASRFSGDAAHELKTPLMILQGELERGIRESPVGSEHQQRYSLLAEEVQRLKGITRKLLLLSLADAGRLKLDLRPTNLSESVFVAADDAEVLDSTLRVERDIAPAVTVLADEALLRQVLQNLVSNAVKYNGGAGFVKIELQTSGDSAEFVIANSGPGIPKRDHGKVFARFYRGDGSHNRRTDGVGLGLSLSREIARAHGGDLVLIESRNDFTAFQLTIPLFRG